MWPAILGTVLSGIMGSRSADRAADAQGRSSAAQLQLGRDQLAQNRDIYDQTLGVSQNVARRQIRAANNTAQDQRGIARNSFNALAGIAGDLRGRQMGIARNVRDAQIQQYQPYADSGLAANAAYQYELGLGARPEGYGGLQETPGYQFMREQAGQMIDGSAASSGNLFSGATLRELSRVGTGMANQYNDQFLNRLEGTRNMGLGAAGGIAAAQAGYGQAAGNAQNTYGNMMYGARDQMGTNIYNAAGVRGQNIQNALGGIGVGQQGAAATFTGGAANSYNFMGNALGNQGDARAAGFMGQNNAWQGAINNGIGLWNYYNQPVGITGSGPMGGR